MGTENKQKYISNITYMLNYGSEFKANTLQSPLQAIMHKSQGKIRENFIFMRHHT